MDPRRHRLVQRRGWDRAAPCYDRFWQRQLQPAQDLLLRKAELQQGDSVIDIACGTGGVTLGAAIAVLSGGRVTASDLSPRMAKATRTAALDAGLSNVEIACCGAEELTPDGPFDAALCSMGLMYVPDPARAVTEFKRVLRAGGRVAVSVWGERRNCGWAEIFGIVDARVSSDVCPLFFGLGQPDRLAHLLEQAGFVDIDQTRISVDLEYGDEHQALGAAFLGGPVALAYGRFDDETRHAVNAEYLASLAGYRRPDGGYGVPGEFVVAAARKP